MISPNMRDTGYIKQRNLFYIAYSNFLADYETPFRKKNKIQR